MGRKYVVKVNGKMYEVEVEEVGMTQSMQQVQPPQSVQPSQPQTPPPQSTSASSVPDVTKTKPVEVSKASPAPAPATVATGNEEKVTAPMSGVVLKVNVKPGDVVKDAQALIVIEAMKMENEILAPRDCKIKEVFVKESQNVEMDQPLLTVE